MADGHSTRTPGELLRAAREARGCDLATAHEGTKIPLNLLDAIERDEYHKLSGPLYVKSFLRSYAAWLGLEPEEILRIYELAAGRPGGAPTGPEMVWSEDQVAVTRVGLPWRQYALIGGGLVVALAIVVGAVLVARGCAVRPTAPGADTGESVDPAPAHVAAAGGSPVAVPAIDPGAGEKTEATMDTTAVAPGAPPSTAPATTTAALPPPARGDASLHFAGGQTYPLVLRVVLPQPTNCSVRCDGQGPGVPLVWPDAATTPPPYNVRPGLAYAVRGGFVAYWGARDNFTLTLDELRGAEVTLNGVPQPVDRWHAGQSVVLDRFTLDPNGG